MQVQWLFIFYQKIAKYYGMSILLIQWRQIILKVGGRGQTYICVTSVRAQRAFIAAGGPGRAVSPQHFFLI